MATGCGACGYKTVSGRGKWPNRDPIGELGGINLYEYAGNDAVDNVDPFGLQDGMANPANAAALEEAEAAAEGLPKPTFNPAERKALSDALGDGLKGSEKIDPNKLKNTCSRDTLNKAAEAAKNGMKKAAEMFKNADNPQSSNAAINQFQTQMNRLNAINQALK